MYPVVCPDDEADLIIEEWLGSINGPVFSPNLCCKSWNNQKQQMYQQKNDNVDE